MKIIQLLASSAMAISLGSGVLAFADIMSKLQAHKDTNINDITQVFDKDIFSGNETTFKKKTYDR